MIIFIIILAALSFFVYTFLKYYFLPKRTFNYYSKTLRQLGYKVYEFPFKPFGSPYFQKYYTYFNSHGDSLYLQKNVFPQYDIILSNVLDTVCLTIQNLQLQKKFYEPQSVYKFIKHPDLSQAIKLSLGNGLIFSEKDAWKRKRKIISKAFNYDLIIKNIPTIMKIADQTLDQIQDQNFGYIEGIKFQFQPKQLGFRIFSRVMMRCFFQTQFKDNKISGIPTYKFLEDLFYQVSQLSNSPLILFFGNSAYNWGLTKTHRNIKQKVRIFHHEVSALIQQKIKKFKSQNQKNCKLEVKNCDLIQKLLYEKEYDGQKLEDQQEGYDTKQILQQFCTFLIVGTDTTTNFLRSIIYYLCKHPQVQAKLRRQVQEHIKFDEDIHDAQKLKKLAYLDCIQHQVIRIACPSITSFIRITQKNILFEDIQLKQGTGIFTEPISNHYNNEYFSEPFQFQPQRWIQNKNISAPHAYTGFFGGPRTCIGKHLAYLESKIVLIRILQRYKKLNISEGGERMEAQILYGPEKYFLQVCRSQK